LRHELGLALADLRRDCLFLETPSEVALEKHLHQMERFLRNRRYRLPACWNKDITLMGIINLLFMPPVDKAEDIYWNTLALYRKNGGGDWSKWVNISRHADPEVELLDSDSEGDQDDTIIIVGNEAEKTDEEMQDVENKSQTDRGGEDMAQGDEDMEQGGGEGRKSLSSLSSSNEKQ
jgi:hypothetical protein